MGLLIAFTSSCRLKKAAWTKPSTPAAQAQKTASAAPVENKTEIPVEEKSADAAAPAKEPRYFYTDLQIVTETTVEGKCPEEKRHTTGHEENSKIGLDNENRLKGEQPVRLFGANVTMQAIGFDLARYVFSSVDGSIPEKIPFGFKLARRPGGLLEMQFLNQTIQMRLINNPIYSFVAEEKRGDCTIKHNVNVFAEKAGFYRAAP